MSKNPPPSLKLLEFASWIAGVALLSAYVSATAWGQAVQQRGILDFEEARQQQSPHVDRTLHEGTNAVVRTAATQTASGDNGVVAVLRIPRIALEVPVIPGTTEPVLRRGAGLIEGASQPGGSGNVAIAAHRDTFFRGLKDVAVGDLIELDALDRRRMYRVTELSVVEPTDVHVLADIGEPVLTLVTCYPFYFVGNAPRRFIVRAVADGSSI